MSKFRFHKIAAVGVFLATAAWVATGDFSSVGSAADEEGATPPPQAEEVEAPLRTVAVVNPPRIMHSRAIRVSGTTAADKRTTVTARAGGIVAELPVEEGARVEKGDLVMKLEAAEKEAAVETARALLEQRRAEAEAAERLGRSGSMPKLQVEAARSALAQARSQLEAAVAELERSEVFAPFGGIVDDVATEIGSSVQAGAQLATILKLDPILAVGQVSERELRHVETGGKAEVRLVNGEEVDGTVRFVSRSASPQTRTYRVEVAVPNEDGSVPAGMTAEVTLRAEPVSAVVLPRSVVTLSGGGDLGIRAVNADDEVVFYPIDLVDDLPQGLVLGGIPEDARVIVAGQELISEGDTVNPVEADQELIDRLIGEATGGA